MALCRAMPSKSSLRALTTDEISLVTMAGKAVLGRCRCRSSQPHILVADHRAAEYRDLGYLPGDVAANEFPHM